jgi:hypothetical protein
MAEWLLRTFPTVVLGAIILVGFPSAAALGCIAFRRRASHLIQAAENDVAGVIVSVLAGIYGIVVAFVIVVLWEDFRSAQDVASSEANSLSQMVQDSDAFPVPNRAAVVDAVRHYVRTVVDDEWVAMRQRRESPTAEAAIGRLYDSLRTFEPSTAVESSFFQDASSNLDQVQTSRRDRIRLSQRGLPGVLQVLIVGGAFLIVLFSYLFGVESQRVHMLMSGGVALLLGFTLLLAVLLQSPFSGDIAVKPSVFREGTLAQFFGRPG